MTECCRANGRMRVQRQRRPGRSVDGFAAVAAAARAATISTAPTWNALPPDTIEALLFGSCKNPLSLLRNGGAAHTGFRVPAARYHLTRRRLLTPPSLAVQTGASDSLALTVSASIT